MESEFDDLLAGTDIDTLDAKLSEIDKILADAQTEYEQYIVETAATGKTRVMRTADDLIWRIKKARNQLPGMFSH